MIKFGINTKIRRQDMGISPAELARRVGCSRQHIAQIERGTNSLSLALAISIAANLETDVYKLADVAKNPPP